MKNSLSIVCCMCHWLYGMQTILLFILYSISRYTILKIYSRQMNDDEMREKHVGGMNSRVLKKHHPALLFKCYIAKKREGAGNRMKLDMLYGWQNNRLKYDTTFNIQIVMMSDNYEF